MKQRVAQYKNVQVIVDLSLLDRASRAKCFLNDDGLTDTHFPINTSTDYTAKCKLLRVNRKDYASYNAVIREMRRRGLRPATIAELLAFMEKFLRERNYLIYALGSSSRGKSERRVPYVAGWRMYGGGELPLKLTGVTKKTYFRVKKCRFLAVKSTQSRA